MSESKAEYNAGDKQETTLVDSLREEADLCRIETAEDVARLLDEAADRIAELEAENARLNEIVTKRFVDECAWCGKQFAPSEFELATQHVRECERNPMLVENARLREALKYVKASKKAYAKSDASGNQFTVNHPRYHEWMGLPGDEDYDDWLIDQAIAPKE